MSSTNSQAPSGSTPSASGSSGNVVIIPDAGTPGGIPQKSAADEHIERLLAEKKKFQQQAKEYEAKLKEIEEAKLKEQGDVAKLLKIRDEELAKEREENQNIKRDLQNGVKLDALLKTIQGNVQREYFPLIDIDQILIDPTTGLPDPSSVQKYAREFEQKYGLVIQRGTGVKLPNDAPQGGATDKLTYAEWQKLPLKDMKARMKDVID